MQAAALRHLNSVKDTHSKVMGLDYSELAPQSYIKSADFSNEELRTLFALRSKMIPVKCNYPGLYINQDKNCSFGCPSKEDQSHLISCTFLIKHLKDKSILAEAEHDDIYEDVKLQKQITDIYMEILEIKKDLERLR